MRSGVDQATTNIVARLNLAPSSIVIPFDGAIATLSGRNTKFLKVKDGVLVTAKGAVPAAVHQYDRAHGFAISCMRRTVVRFSAKLATSPKTRTFAKSCARRLVCRGPDAARYSTDCSFA